MVEPPVNSKFLFKRKIKAERKSIIETGPRSADYWHGKVLTGSPLTPFIGNGSTCQVLKPTAIAVASIWRWLGAFPHHEFYKELHFVLQIHFSKHKHSWLWLLGRLTEQPSAIRVLKLLFTNMHLSVKGWIFCWSVQNIFCSARLTLRLQILLGSTI